MRKGGRRRSLASPVPRNINRSDRKAARRRGNESAGLGGFVRGYRPRTCRKFNVSGGRETRQRCRSLPALGGESGIELRFFNQSAPVPDAHGFVVGADQPFLAPHSPAEQGCDRVYGHTGGAFNSTLIPGLSDRRAPGAGIPTGARLAGLTEQRARPPLGGVLSLAHLFDLSQAAGETPGRPTVQCGHMDMPKAAPLASPTPCCPCRPKMWSFSF